MPKMIRNILGASLALGAIVVADPVLSQSVLPDEAQAISKEAYIWDFLLVEMCDLPSAF